MGCELQVRNLPNSDWKGADKTLICCNNISYNEVVIINKTKLKYSDYIYEITSNEIYDGLVGCGMFAEKIPNFLTSSAFLNYTKTLTLPLTSVKDKDYIRYSSMRNINIPRPMALPEPFAYANLCNCISQDWNRIQKFFQFETRNQKYKVSRIHLRKMDNNCSLFEMNYIILPKNRTIG